MLEYIFRNISLHPSPLLATKGLDEDKFVGNDCREGYLNRVKQKMEEFGPTTLFNARGPVGIGCLYYATRYGNEQIVSLLIAHDIDVNQRF